ncbi:MAG: T9SS type A sorting domain-containing protein [Chitinophagales bacterium]|nr:T9SS type A sorting domain-containing protein [Chitinophagales bacterium]
MRKTLITVASLLIGCGVFSQSIQDISFGTDSTLEVITWNLEWYPKVGNSTNFYLTQIIEELNADIYALQEIHDTSYFNKLLKSLPDYNAFVAYNGNLSLAYLFNKNTIQVNDIYEIYSNKARELPRSPLVIDFCFGEQDFIAINNHLKCCGNGSLNQNDPWDEETRRRDACELLDKFIDDNHFNTNVIVLGDFNDLLIDNSNHNVFNIFLNNDLNYRFADMDIADGGSQNWSYPDWPSHLDHILITDELFDEISNPNSITETIRIDDYMSGGWSTYETYISDHRPVAVKFKLNESPLSIEESAFTKEDLKVYPNPSDDRISIGHQPATQKTKIRIFNSHQKLIVEIFPVTGQKYSELNATGFPRGIYFVKVYDNGVLSGVRKVVLQ